MKEFPKFWYESNAIWGDVESIEDLTKMFNAQIAESNGINTVEDFLTKSTSRTFEKNPCFGTSFHVQGSKTLMDFLTEKEVLVDFLTHLSNQK